MLTIRPRGGSKGSEVLDDSGDAIVTKDIVEWHTQAIKGPGKVLRQPQSMKSTNGPRGRQSTPHVKPEA